MKKARFDWKKEHLSVDDSKKMWSRVKKIAGLSKVVTEDMEIDAGDKVLTKPEELAPYMNSFFKSKVERLQEKLIVNKEAALEYAKEYMETKLQGEKFKFETVGTGKITKIIKSLKNTGAQGRDQISTKILKKFKGILSPSLRHIVNISTTTGIYPEGWKLGLITPLPKSGNLNIAKNWRPITILPAASKILEGVLQSQLQDYMEVRGIYSDSQHAYRHSRSCESAGYYHSEGAE